MWYILLETYTHSDEIISAKCWNASDILSPCDDDTQQYKTLKVSKTKAEAVRMRVRIVYHGHYSHTRTNSWLLVATCYLCTLEWLWWQIKYFEITNFLLYCSIDDCSTCHIWLFIHGELWKPVGILFLIGKGANS